MEEKPLLTTVQGEGRVGGEKPPGPEDEGWREPTVVVEMETDGPPPKPPSKFRKVWNKLGDAGRVALAALLAIVIGVSLKSANASDATTFRIIGWFGSLWVRALKLTVLPLIFTTMITAMANIRKVSNSGRLGLRTFLYFFSTTFVALTISIICVVSFLVPHMSVIDESSIPSDVIGDKPDEVTRKAPLDQVESILHGLVPDNIVSAMANDNLIGVILFGMVLGIYLPDGNVLRFVDEVAQVMGVLIGRLIILTPLGVFSLILPKVATINIDVIGKYLSLLVGVEFLGLTIHTLVFFPVMYFALVRKNPFKYYKNIAPAMLTALGTSSSAATLPMTIKCAVENNNLDPSVANFVLPLGATVNMDGAAIKYPVLVTWLAYSQGMTFTAGDFVLLALVSSLGTVGSAPIPQAGLSIWIMVMTTMGVPVNGLIGLVLAIEWLMDRVETMVNITSDSFGVGVICKFTPPTPTL